jgi:arylformamidase
MTIVDLTHPITDRIPIYFPWHPGTSIEQTANYAENQCVVHKLSIGTHTGTHVDAPVHIFEGMNAIDEYDLNLWYADAQVLDFTPRRPRQNITLAEFRHKGIKSGVGVIMKTGWDVHFGSPDYYKTYPPIDNDAAEYLVEKEIPFLASDTPFTLDLHKILLKHGIPLITNLNNTSKLTAGIVKLITAPLPIKGADGSPARVLAITGN